MRIQLGALETINSKPISRVNHGASSAAVAVAMLCPRPEGCELRKHALTQGWPLARAVVTAGADLPALGISPCTHVRGGFLVSAPLSGQAGIYALRCGLNSHSQHSICTMREGNYVSGLSSACRKHVWKKIGWRSFKRTCGLRSKSGNHRTVWVGRDIEDHLFPLLPWCISLDSPWKHLVCCEGYQGGNACY